MTTIKELIKKIDSISSQKLISNTHMSLTKNISYLNESRRIYMECKETSKSINSIFSNFEINYDTSIKEDIDSLIETLPKKSEYLKNVNIQECEKKIKDIKSKCFQSKEDIKEKWENILRDKILFYKQMAVTAGHLDVDHCIEENGRKLTEALNEAPFNKNALELVKAAISDIEKDIKKLPTGDEENKFLKDAMEGNADAQLLYDPKIKEFIERNDLIKKLKIKISGQ
jgi:hypothetical protein